MEEMEAQLRRYSLKCQLGRYDTCFSTLGDADKAFENQHTRTDIRTRTGSIRHYAYFPCPSECERLHCPRRRRGLSFGESLFKRQFIGRACMHARRCRFSPLAGAAYGADIIVSISLSGKVEAAVVVAAGLYTACYQFVAPGDVAVDVIAQPRGVNIKTVETFLRSFPCEGRVAVGIDRSSHSRRSLRIILTTEYRYIHRQTLTLVVDRHYAVRVESGCRLGVNP